MKLTYELMKSVELLKSKLVRIAEPRIAAVDELLLFHDTDYVDLVKKMSAKGTGYFDMGDTPAFKGCYEASALAAGASLTAVDLVMSGQAQHGLNISGGLHHAHPDHASGFCIFNDPAISIAYVKKKYTLHRVLYLDVDAHHGDGVMYGFYSDAGVLDIDFHEDGRHLFPGTGFVDEVGAGEAAGLKINIPLPPFVGDEAYLRLFKEIVPRAVRKFRPEILLLQCGADSHANDLLAHLQLTTRAYREIARVVHDLAHEVAGGRLVIFGGGGYNIANVVRAWTVVASELVEYPLPSSTPESWRKIFEALVGEKAPEEIGSEQEVRRDFSQIAGESFVDDLLAELRKRIPLLA